MAPKAQAMKKKTPKIHKLDFKIKKKNFCSLKHTVNKMKKQAGD